MIFMSFPTRERGLKSADAAEVIKQAIVVPHAGTWIEIETGRVRWKYGIVVPHAGTWIEILWKTD